MNFFLMTISHNIRTLVHSIFELGITMPGLSVDGTSYTLRS